ncbi:MAG: phage tail sheath family protein [Solirubrobacteraceae bacterium]
MSAYHTPGIYVEEVPAGPRPIQAVGTSTAAFVGRAPKADAFPLNPQAVNNWSEFTAKFLDEAAPASTVLSNAVYGFFENGGSRCYVVNTGEDPAIIAALAALEAVDEVAIVAAPGLSDAPAHKALLAHCENLKDRVAILDPPEVVEDIELLTQAETAAAPGDGGRKKGADAEGPAEGGLWPGPSDKGFGAFYFPWITVQDPITSDLVNVPPSGHMAGIWARTDSTRGVHKAPANETVAGAVNLARRITRAENGVLNDAGVNCIRLFAREGFRVWGARTVADPASEWRYLNVRRLFNMIEESIAEGTNWIVFEPNDRTLWKHIRRDVGAFLTGVWRDGGLMGATPEQAFFVKCDEETNTQDDIDAGRVIAIIGIAPVKPAEFIVFRISQSTAGAATSAPGPAIAQEV